MCTALVGEDLLDDLRKFAQIGGDEAGRLAEARVALDHIVAEADLAHLAIADDVDAGFELLLDHLRHGAPDACAHLDRIAALAVDLVPHHAGEVIRPRQAACVSCQNAIGTSLHDCAPCRPGAPSIRPPGPPTIGRARIARQAHAAGPGPRQAVHSAAAL